MLKDKTWMAELTFPPKWQKQSKMKWRKIIKTINELILNNNFQDKGLFQRACTLKF